MPAASAAQQLASASTSSTGSLVRRRSPRAARCVPVAVGDDRGARAQRGRARMASSRCRSPRSSCSPRRPSPSSGRSPRSRTPADARDELGDDARGARPAASGGRGERRADEPPSRSPLRSREPAEADVLGAAATLVPTARRARFEALYVALSQSPAGGAGRRRPAPRARSRSRVVATRRRSRRYERAATAWDVLPVVYATDGMTITDSVEMQEAAASTASSPGGARGSRTSSRAGRRAAGEMVSVDVRQARSGVAVGARGRSARFVRRRRSRRRSTSLDARRASASVGAVLRAPTAAQELVQTGRPSGRHGGGEVEIPRGSRPPRARCSRSAAAAPRTASRSPSSRSSRPPPSSHDRGVVDASERAARPWHLRRAARRRSRTRNRRSTSRSSRTRSTGDPGHDGHCAST